MSESHQDSGAATRISSWEVPLIVRSAGEDAVSAYVAYFEQSARTVNTKNTYRQNGRRFLRWAESRGLALEAIGNDEIAAFSAEVCAAMSKRSAKVYLSPIRGFFRHLVSAGVLAENPLGPGRSRSSRSAAEEVKEPSIPLAELKRFVLETGAADGWVEDSEDVQAGLVMLAPLSIGTRDPVAISRFTGVPESLVREFTTHLAGNGIWRLEGKVAANWFDPENGSLSFMLDVWVAMGLLDRKSVPDGHTEAPASDLNLAEPKGSAA